MPQVGEYADIFRALGRFLDDLNAASVQIDNQGEYMAVRWNRTLGSVQERIFRERDLDALREQARAMRRGLLKASPSRGSLAELLRTLGQELDRDKIEVSTISQNEVGFDLTGTVDRRYVRRSYVLSELEAISTQRMVLRGGAAPPEDTSYAARFKRLVDQGR
ncbi:MAG TPA: hypothetical protein VFC51_05790 [Chloroflexota bacterium]|nr:hypothetical protein [Chloroflexota bacterium]